MLRLAIFSLSCSSPRLQGSVLRTALGDTSSKLRDPRSLVLEVENMIYERGRFGHHAHKNTHRYTTIERRCDDHLRASSLSNSTLANNHRNFEIKHGSMFDLKSCCV